MVCLDQRLAQIKVAMKESKAWFEEWFDTSEYHTLYGHRDEAEADDFVDSICKELDLSHCNVLDAGCGAGRHVLAWASRGHDATGFDLSNNSILKAKYRAELRDLHNAEFHVLDLRNLKDYGPWRESYDLVTNLFTSFGYFTDEQDHIDVVKGFAYSLKDGGILILDYLNPKYSESRLVASEIVVKKGVEFQISRKIEHGYFTKTISYISPDIEECSHTELVKAWSVSELSELLSSVGLHVKSVVGDYDFSEYSEDTPRMILIAKKI